MIIISLGKVRAFSFSVKYSGAFVVIFDRFLISK